MEARKRLNIIATTVDLVALLTAIESERPLKYTRSMFADSPDLELAYSFQEIPGFGNSRHGKLILDDSFVVSDPNWKIDVEANPQHRGGVKYLVDITNNRNAVRFNPGGIYHGNTVISGEVLKCADEPDANEIFKLFQREVKRQFIKHKSYPYWLGKEAAGMLAAGARLTDDVDSTFDLPLE